MLQITKIWEIFALVLPRRIVVLHRATVASPGTAAAEVLSCDSGGLSSALGIWKLWTSLPWLRCAASGCEV